VDPLTLAGFGILLCLVAVLGAMLRLITERGRYVGRCKSPDECAAKHDELMHYRRIRNAEKPDEPYDGLDVADSA
jgi:hypothetical protein